jgi:hypothetical protein
MNVSALCVRYWVVLIELFRAQRSKFTITVPKTKEVVFHPSGLSCKRLPKCLGGIEQVSSVSLLGCIFNEKLRFTDLIDFILRTINQRLHSLNQLKHCGLDQRGIFDSVILSHLIYALLLYVVSLSIGY